MACYLVSGGPGPQGEGQSTPCWGLTVPGPPWPGLLWQLRPSDVEVELLAHTRRVVSRDLEEETGLHTGWIQNGGLFIASNQQRLDEYKRLMSVRALPGWGAPYQGSRAAQLREGAQQIWVQTLGLPLMDGEHET